MYAEAKARMPGRMTTAQPIPQIPGALGYSHAAMGSHSSSEKIMKTSSASLTLTKRDVFFSRKPVRVICNRFGFSSCTSHFFSTLLDGDIRRTMSQNITFA